MASSMTFGVSAKATQKQAIVVVNRASGLSAKRCISSTATLKAQQVTSSVRTAASRSTALNVRAEISYVMIKPDGVQRGLVGSIISRFEAKGFQLKGLKMFRCPRELAEEHYSSLNTKPFFKDLVNYIISGPVVCIALEGNGVIKSARKIIGATNPLEAEPGTIRGDHAIMVGRNVIHGSDSVENGEIEVKLWFNDAELCEWDMSMSPWLVE